MKTLYSKFELSVCDFLFASRRQVQDGLTDGRVQSEMQPSTRHGAISKALQGLNHINRFVIPCLITKLTD